MPARPRGLRHVATGLVAGLVLALPSPAVADHATRPHFHPGVVVTVIDEIAPNVEATIRRRRRVVARPRSEWRQSRDEVLTAYASATGLTFSVVEQPGSWYEQPNTFEDAEAQYQGDGYIRLARGPTAYATQKLDAGGHAVAGHLVTAEPTQGYPYIGLLCHELGHVLGLDHRAGGCMDYADVTGYELPDAHDLEALSALYAHQDPAGG
ncbi:MAG: hypothetical protein ACRDHM_01040 [Actinomycetota bacterium]